jgi:glycosyltransferase involved in cell wall biosynthesis
VAVSQFVADRATRVFGLRPPQLTVAHNGIVVPNHFNPRPLREVKRVVCVAQLIAEKGVDVLLRALGEVSRSDWHLEVVGEGPARDSLEHSAASLGLGSRVVFSGRRDDVPALFAGADIAVHPAVWQEAFGYTVVEALGAGCALIATETGGIPEIVQDGVSGILVRPGSAEALAHALDRLLSDHGLRNSLGSSGHRRVQEHFDIDSMVDRYFAVADRIEF